ncbi:hypothetical protein ADIWIN_0607 [Winogradskyella psychrotolerans RS-3]|uniref:Uncharacterized protein n=1 Tax=Winogradskyella psychrotolerans RS-3 TaxID=641526 RepID=S7VWL5_9FLAO|nr:hypothetical protein ADIWIN_0607 [Winogradskyella psychrotolerans RS-3]
MAPEPSKENIALPEKLTVSPGNIPITPDSFGAGVILLIDGVIS